MITADFSEFQCTYEDVGDHGNMPIISLEVMSDSSNTELGEGAYVNEIVPNTNIESAIKDVTTGVHFLMEQNSEDIESTTENGKNEVVSKGRSDLLEYMTRSDGSVICKLCGEILQSRTHWYRHKYKVHNIIQPLNPAPLFQCEQCLVYFKSRKGYIGHLSSRHSDISSDTNPVLSKTQVESNLKEKVPIHSEIKEDSDPELVIPTSSVPNYQTAITKPAAKSIEPKKTHRVKEQVQARPADWEEQRSREDKMVIDIIDRVRRECEAQQGVGGGPARRGYSRRSTIMHT